VLTITKETISLIKRIHIPLPQYL